MTENVLKIQKKSTVTNSIDIVQGFVTKAFEERKKSLGFSSTHYMSQQQKAILLATKMALQEKPNLKIAIVSFSLQTGYFQDLLKESRVIVEGEKFSVHQQLYFVSWDALIKNQAEHEVVDEYDFIFWELPEIEYISANQKLLQKSFSYIQSLAIVSNRLESHDDEQFLKAIDQYFQVHGVKIEAFENKEKISISSRRKPFLRKIFKRAA